MIKFSIALITNFSFTITTSVINKDTAINVDTGKIKLIKYRKKGVVDWK